MPLLLIFLIFLPYTVHAENLSLDDALRATWTSCVGIDKEISELKTMAGISTAVTATGTASGIAATAVGAVKSKTDKEIDELIVELRQEYRNENNGNAYMPGLDEEIESFKTEFDKLWAEEAAIKSNEEFQKLDTKSEKLGNWRTGLLAGNTATNIAGAVISGTNMVDVNLQDQINTCVESVKTLRKSIIQAHINGQDTTEAEHIASVCGEFEYVDISAINKRAKGATVSSSIGAATGLAGVVTSAIANSDNVRQGLSQDDRKKNQNLNTSANALSIGTTAASIVATTFNATQIAAINKVATVSSECTKALQ